MSWRSRLEDKHTVICKHCKTETIDPNKKPNQKYSKGKCSACDN